MPPKKRASNNLTRLKKRGADILKPLKTTIKRLEGRGKSSSFRAITKIILIFKYLLTYYEQRVNIYKQKANNYYSKLDNSPAYYAATILYLMYKYYYDKA
ncbi:hypothetical protein BU23DRAFT_581701 [Bimuria novae-zelandiae CBS 107.79]|uniref:Uncharacterized protein n=1 Tax=Bimuria novae-zelandiae CBS 107.79 TaxID=1447943 RepID=A0A6A5V2K2_9PLEO|nr:hypothetical protein BU23DRAFT_581701 [Bimuria novae-zelandiae CBS 107.79]